MRAIFTLILMIAGLCFGSYAQSSQSRDRVFTQDGEVYEGHITTDAKGDYLVINVGQNTSRTISYKNILKIQYDIDHPKSKSEEGTVLKKRDDNELTTFSGSRSNSIVPQSLIHRRNVGIGLTAAGGALLVTGIALMAVTQWPTYDLFSGSAPDPKGVIGILLAAGGVSMTIPGAAIWGGANAKIRKINETAN